MPSILKRTNKIILLLFILFPLLTFSQVKHCGTSEYWEQKKRQVLGLTEAEKKANQDAADWIAARANKRTTEESITVPVVVHVIYHADEENISDEQIYSQ